MTCENRFCVYWSRDNCTLSEVRLDGMGSCEDCIVVEVPEELLEILFEGLGLEITDTMPTICIIIIWLCAWFPANT